MVLLWIWNYSESEASSYLHSLHITDKDAALCRIFSILNQTSIPKPEPKSSAPEVEPSVALSGTTVSGGTAVSGGVAVSGGTVAISGGTTVSGATAVGRSFRRPEFVDDVDDTTAESNEDHVRKTKAILGRLFYVMLPSLQETLQQKMCNTPLDPLTLKLLYILKLHSAEPTVQG